MSAARRRERYLERKLSGRCIHCNAGLGDDDGLTCVECTEARSRWSATESGKRSSREAQRRYLQTERGKESNRAKSRRYRAKAIARGTCLQCSERATRGLLCEKHGAAHVEQSRAWRARRASEGNS